MTALRWLLIAHSSPGYESEFENFSRFLSIERPQDVVEVIGLPLGGCPHNDSVRGIVVGGQLPNQRSYWVGSPLHAVQEVALPTRIRANVLIGFDPISVLHGRNCRSEVTVLWGIDFVPTRGNWFLDRVYRRLERKAMRLVDLQIENNTAARDARQEASGVIPARSSIVPITIDTSIFASRPSSSNGLRLAFLGSLNKRTGAHRLLPILEALRSLGVSASLDIIGGGPLIAELRQQSSSRDLNDQVKLHGFVNGDEQVAGILSTCNVGLAPFSGEHGDFTWFADPQKIKLYLAAGLHVVTSDVPPIAKSVKEHEAGSLLEVNATNDEWAQHLQELSGNPEQLALTQAHARNLARTFERSVAYDNVLKEVLEFVQ